MIVRRFYEWVFLWKLYFRNSASIACFSFQYSPNRTLNNLLPLRRESLFILPQGWKGLREYQINRCAKARNNAIKHKKLPPFASVINMNACLWWKWLPCTEKGSLGCNSFRDRESDLGKRGMINYSCLPPLSRSMFWNSVELWNSLGELFLGDTSCDVHTLKSLGQLFGFILANWKP